MTVYGPSVGKVWLSGSWSDDVDVPPSGSVNVHSHWVGLPPDVSRNSTLNGATPVIVAGAETDVMTPFPLNAALGGLPPPPAPLPLAVIPVLTGKLELAATMTVPPTTLAMPGVMTWKRQPICTCPVSPMSVVLPLPFRSVKVGVKSLASIVPSPFVSTRLQLIALASAMIWL